MFEQKNMIQRFYRVVHRFGQAKLGFGNWVLGSVMMV